MSALEAFLLPRIDSMKLSFGPFETGFACLSPVPAIWTSKPVSYVKAVYHSVALKQVLSYGLSAKTVYFCYL